MKESQDTARYVADFFRARAWIMEYLQKVQNTEDGQRKLKDLNESWHEWGMRSPIEMLQEERNGRA